ncbi:non-canonical purine NTP pyrophosphatase [Thermopolyspora sp. NPDC052614]
MQSSCHDVGGSAGSDLTFAEMSSEQKNAISHRRMAVDALRMEFGLAGV